MEKFIETSVSDQIANVRLNRPDVHNAFNEVMIQQLTETFQQLGNSSEVRVVLITSGGKSFCAGGDIHWMKKMVNFSEKENLEDANGLALMYRTIRECPKPVIARVHGAAIGGGVGLVSVADIAVALDSAKFAFSEVKLGILPAVIAPFVMERTGLGPLRRLALTAELFSAADAKAIGLVSEVVDSIESLDKSISTLCDLLRNNGPMAMAACKRLLQDVARIPSDWQQALTTKRIAEVRVSPEGQEGLNAFLEKRKPKWIT